MLAFRRVLEECGTVAEAEKLLRDMPRTTTCCMTICDKSGGVVFEITPKHIEVREMPSAPRGGWGKGTMHHVAWRVADTKVQLAVRAQVAAAQRRPTEVIDRFWFKSVYFKEPGGVLFEIATDGPGFAVDEDAAHLGETLVLPPWLEPARPRIEEVLPPLTMHAPVAGRE